MRDLPAGAKIELGIRPEFIRALRQRRAACRAASSRVDDVGRYRVVKLDLDGQLFNVIADEDAEIDGDDRASVVFDPANVHIYADGRLVEGKPLGGSGMMDKTWNNRAWFMVLPVLILVAFNAIIPLMTVVNYSVQETFGDNVFFFHGVEMVRGRAAFGSLPCRAAAAS